MRVFVYEHLTAGAGEDDALLAEGDVMIRALLRDLACVPGIEALTLRDTRLPADVPAQVLHPSTRGDVWPAFLRCLAMCDAVWPIAPESAECLERLSRQVLDSGRTLLNSRPDAVRITASKLRTSQRLACAGVPVVPTWAHAGEMPGDVAAVVIKPDDGAGCIDTHVLRGAARARVGVAPGHVLQPFIAGEALSLSLLCCEGRARLLSVNRQHLRELEERLDFLGVTVNALPDRDGQFAQLGHRVAAAIPELWGHVGVDLVRNGDALTVIEVNPRLTTSCAGLRDALGINLAALVLGLPGSLRDAVLPEPGSGRALALRLDGALAHAPETI